MSGALPTLGAAAGGLQQGFLQGQDLRRSNRAQNLAERRQAFTEQQAVQDFRRVQTQDALRRRKLLADIARTQAGTQKTTAETQLLPAREKREERKTRVQEARERRQVEEAKRRDKKLVDLGAGPEGKFRGMVSSILAEQFGTDEQGRNLVSEKDVGQLTEAQFEDFSRNFFARRRLEQQKQLAGDRLSQQKKLAEDRAREKRLQETGSPKGMTEKQALDILDRGAGLVIKARSGLADDEGIFEAQSNQAFNMRVFLRPDSPLSKEAKVDLRERYVALLGQLGFSETEIQQQLRSIDNAEVVAGNEPADQFGADLDAELGPTPTPAAVTTPTPRPRILRKRFPGQ